MKPRVFQLCAPQVGYALLRVVAGSLFAMHGSLKLFGLPGDGEALPLSCASLPCVGGAIELATGALIALGFFVRGAAFVASGEMAVAYFLAHAPNSVWPIVNGGELAALYSFLFLYVAARGAGACSVDAGLARWLHKRRSASDAAGWAQDAGTAALS